MSILYDPVANRFTIYPKTSRPRRITKQISFDIQLLDLILEENNQRHNGERGLSKTVNQMLLELIEFKLRGFIPESSATPIPFVICNKEVEAK